MLMLMANVESITFNLVLWLHKGFSLESSQVYLPVITFTKDFITAAL